MLSIESVPSQFHLVQLPRICTQEPLAVVVEFLEHGDLCQYLRRYDPTYRKGFKLDVTSLKPLQEVNLIVLNKGAEIQTLSLKINDE
jgi:hypothetical protein